MAVATFVTKVSASLELLIEPTETPFKKTLKVGAVLACFTKTMPSGSLEELTVELLATVLLLFNTKV